MGSNRDYFYFVEDVMKMLDLSRAKCYEIIKQLNRELEDAGYLTVAGRVPKRYFDSRYYTGPAAPPQKPKAQPPRRPSPAPFGERRTSDGKTTRATPLRRTSLTRS